MKYVKTFESFNYDVINEAMTPELKEKIKAEVKRRIDKMSAGDKEKLAGEVVQFAQEKGLDAKQLSDPNAIQAAIEKKDPSVKQENPAEAEKALDQAEQVIGEAARFFYEGEMLNENWLMDKLKQAGNWLAKWLWRIGLAAMIGSIIIGVLASLGIVTGLVAAVSIVVSMITLYIGGIINQQFGEKDARGRTEIENAAAPLGPIKRGQL